MKKNVFLVGLLLMAAACSSDNVLTEEKAADALVEMKPTARMAVTAEATRAPGIITQAVGIDEMTIIRADDTGAGYDISNASLLALKARVAAPDADIFGVATFDIAVSSTNRSFLADGKKTKVFGLHPYKDVTAISTGVVTYSIDGNTDIMSSGEAFGGEGYKPTDGTAVVQPTLTLIHELTKIQIQAYATDAIAQTTWGDITSITIDDQSSTCEITLPSPDAAATVAYDVAFSGTLEDMTVKQSPGTGNFTLQTGANLAAVVGEVKYGYCMIAPSEVALTLTLNTTTVTGQVVTVLLPGSSITDGKFKKGYSYIVTLQLGLTEIKPEVTITEWIDETNLPVIEL